MVHSGNFYLTLAQMKDNAEYILDYLTARGWTKNAICGMLGNMQTESNINPGIWQNLDAGNTRLGYGLVQWTPATKYLNWCDDLGLTYGAMDSNLQRILYEVEENIQWGDDSNGNPPPFDFYTFTKSNLPPYELGMLFLIYYERPGNQNQPSRGTQAEYWYNTLEGGSSGGEGGTGFIPKRNEKFFMYLGRKRRFI